MTDKEFRHLKRIELIDIIYKLQNNEEKLRAQNASLKKQLEERRIRIDKAGSIAEASLSLNDVFASAQEAADQYVAEVQRMHEDVQNQTTVALETAQNRAQKIMAEAKERSGVMVSEAESTSKAMLLEAQMRRDEILLDAETKSSTMLKDAEGKSTVMLSEAEERSTKMVAEAKEKTEKNWRDFEEKVRNTIEANAQLKNLMENFHK